MKKISKYFLIALSSTLVFLLGFGHQATKQPNVYYKVYLDNEDLGLIESKKDLEYYINNQAKIIKENIKDYSLKLEAIDTFQKYESNVNLESNLNEVKYLIANKKEYNLLDIDVDNLKYYEKNKLYNYTIEEVNDMRLYVHKNDIYNYINNVYKPEGTKIKKTYTYDNNLMTTEQIYKKIMSKKSSTIPGYKFTIKSNLDGVKDIVIYTIDKDIFSKAIEDLITIFVDETKYELYKSNNQTEITETGSMIENVYVNEDITYKAVNIPVEEQIYTSSKDLSAYLLYGDNYEQKTVQVKKGDSIETLAIENEITIQEFLISNPIYTSKDNLLVAGEDVTISKLDPKVQVVVESYEVVDKSTSFPVVEQYDDTLTQGSVVVSQEGQNGLERISQNVKKINGEISYVDPVDKKVIKSPISKIINLGTKYVPTVGSIGSWGWPTDSGYTLSSYFGWRTFGGYREFHNALDIAGTGYGSKVYASNNGTIKIKTYNSSYGNYIMIDHNNGYYSLYAHMSSFSKDLSVGSTVSRGQVIGYVGSTGRASGPHLHYEIRTCEKYSCVTNPLNYYR